MLFKKKARNGDGVVAAMSDSPQPTLHDTDGDMVDEPKAAALAPVKSTATEDIVYPSGLKLALLMTSVYTSMFLVSLDRLIISTAIPQITDDFNSVTDIGWYGSVYLLTNCGFQLAYGKLYTLFSVKAVFLTAVFLFEVGSAICGAAPNSVSFIIGRAIAGLGSAGIMSGAIVVMVYAVPLHRRPLFQGLFGAIFGLSSVIGPLLGGAFTTKVTWRWCFYINLPFGGVAMAVIALVLQIPDREETKLSLMKKLAQLDGFGTAALLPGVICLLLALQWGGVTYPWSEGRIIALLVLGGVLLISFVVIQIVKPDTATVPPRILTQRSILAGFWATFCNGSQMMVFVYYLPIWFQAIKGVSAIDSGIRLLPMVLPMVASSIVTGILTTRIGYYTPFMLFGNCLMAIGAGLLNTLQIDTPQAKWIGYQVIFGWGIGHMFQAPSLAAQTVLPNRDVPVGSSLMFFSQFLGGAIFISVGQSVFNNELFKRLRKLPGFNPKLITDSGATGLIQRLPAAIRHQVLVDYNASLRKAFEVGLVMACVAILGALAMEWKSVKKNVSKKHEPAESQAENGNAGAEKGTGSEDKVPGATSSSEQRTEEIGQQTGEEEKRRP